jgi:8-oxo-dGTP diphosphatase
MIKRLYPDQPIVGVGAVILREGCILLEQRKNQPDKDKWTIPGGVVEVGERLEDAVIRETKEETGLDASNPKIMGVVQEITQDPQGKTKYHFVIVDYQVTAPKGEPTPDSDANALNWVPIEKVEEYDLTSSFRVFFQQNKKKLANSAR